RLVALIERLLVPPRQLAAAQLAMRFDEPLAQVLTPGPRQLDHGAFELVGVNGGGVDVGDEVEVEAGVALVLAQRQAVVDARRLQLVLQEVLDGAAHLAVEALPRHDDHGADAALERVRPDAQPGSALLLEAEDGPDVLLQLLALGTEQFLPR